MILFNKGIISEEGRGHATGNILIGQLRRTMRCEEVGRRYLAEISAGIQLSRLGIHLDNGCT
jgi:hypothetical protein